MAELAGMYPSHVTDYLCDTDTDRKGRERRDMPAKYIRDFEAITGNTFVSQFIAHQSKLTILETMLMQAAA